MKKNWQKKKLDEKYLKFFQGPPKAQKCTPPKKFTSKMTFKGLIFSRYIRKKNWQKQIFLAEKYLKIFKDPRTGQKCTR